MAKADGQVAPIKRNLNKRTVPTVVSYREKGDKMEQKLNIKQINQEVVKIQKAFASIPEIDNEAQNAIKELETIISLPGIQQEIDFIKNEAIESRNVKLEGIFLQLKGYLSQLKELKASVDSAIADKTAKRNNIDERIIKLCGAGSNGEASYVYTCEAVHLEDIKNASKEALKLGKKSLVEILEARIAKSEENKKNIDELSKASDILFEEIEADNKEKEDIYFVKISAQECLEKIENILNQ